MPKQLDRPFKWDDAAKETALNLVFEGRLSQAEIAKKCEVSPRTIWGWVNHPGFQQRLQEKRADLQKALDGVTYASKARRIIALDQMAESARAEYEARPWLQEKRQIGFDKEHEGPLYLINEAFNAEAHKAFRESLNDIAKELGERKEKEPAAVNAPQVIIYLPEIDGDPSEMPRSTIPTTAVILPDAADDEA